MPIGILLIFNPAQFDTLAFSVESWGTFVPWTNHDWFAADFDFNVFNGPRSHSIFNDCLKVFPVFPFHHPPYPIV